MHHQLCLIGKLAMRLYYSSRTGLRTHLMMIACIVLDTPDYYYILICQMPAM